MPRNEPRRDPFGPADARREHAADQHAERAQHQVGGERRVGDADRRAVGLVSATTE